MLASGWGCSTVGGKMMERGPTLAVCQSSCWAGRGASISSSQAHGSHLQASQDFLTSARLFVAAAPMLSHFI